MRYDPLKHHRRSIRLKGYDYSRPGMYFVTICTRNHCEFLGKIHDNRIQLNAFGNIVTVCWFDLRNHYTNIELDAFSVMPNHVHYIIKIVKFIVRAGSPRPSSSKQGSPRPSSTVQESLRSSPSAQRSPHPFLGSESPRPNIENNRKFPKGAWEPRPYIIDNRSKKWTLGQMIAYFKYKSTKQINELRKMPGFPIWKRGFYDRIIRNDAELYKIRQYILDNPKNWDIDKNDTFM